jgi:ketosteroid isomerase-like protein
MRKALLFAGVILSVSFVVSSCGANTSEVQSAPTGTSATDNTAKGEQSLRAANDSFYAALNDMFIGNMASMDSIWSHSADITDQGPFGGRLLGWDAVEAEFKKEADMKLGGKVVCKEVVVHAGADMGYTACVEEGENVSTEGKTVTVRHRATNVFRLENSKWKLVHHHTDISLQLEKAIGIENK